jgi:hypothetical protein
MSGSRGDAFDLESTADEEGALLTAATPGLAHYALPLSRDWKIALLCISSPVP